MTSKNDTVNKAHEVIKKRIQKLLQRKADLRERIEKKYPEDACGLRGCNLWEKKSREIDAEIKLLRDYDSGLYDLIEIIEKKGWNIV